MTRHSFEPRPLVLAALLLLPASALADRSAAAEPILSVDTDYGTLEVVHVEDFDPPPPGDATPPDIAYASFSIKKPMVIEDAAAAEEALLPAVDDATAELHAAGWIHGTDLATLSPREFALVIAHLTRRTLDVPLAPPEVDDYTFEQLMTGRLGVCRHLSIFAETAALLLQHRCPAARDLHVTAFGDTNTHSWIRAAAVVPDGEGWRLVETHLDVSAMSTEPAFVDVSKGAHALRYPLAALVLDRAGLEEAARERYVAFAADPAHGNRGVTMVSVLVSHYEQEQWQETVDVAGEVLAILSDEERGMAERALPTTVEQLCEMRVAVWRSLADIHERVPDITAPKELPPPDTWAGRRDEERAFYDDVQLYAGDLEGDLASLELQRARQRLDKAEKQDAAHSWAWRAMYAEILGRTKRVIRRTGDDDLLLALALERQRVLPGDEDVAEDLANVMLRQVQRLQRETGGIPPQQLPALLEHGALLPEGIPESHLVLAQLADAAGDPGEAGAQYVAMLAACDALPPDQVGPREQTFRAHALVELEHLAEEGQRPQEVVQRAGEALAAIRVLAADPTLTDTQRDNTALLYWDAGITLTVAKADPFLAVELWRSFAAWAPDNTRADYGLARGLGQLAIGQIEAGEDASGATAREAAAALEAVIAMDVPVPNSDRFLRIGWFNLGTALENMQRFDEALEVERGAIRALPNEPLGPIMVARTLSLRASTAQGDEACAAVTGDLDEAQTLLAALDPPAIQEDFLQASAPNAWRSLIIAAYNCGDLERAAAAATAAVQAYPKNAEILRLNETVRSRIDGG